MEATRKAPRNPLLALLAAALVLSSAPAHAALGDHLWSTGYGSGGVADVDGSGNTVVFGTFFGTIDLGGGPMTAVNFLGGDLYLARYDSSGNHLWSQQFTPDMSFGVFDIAVRLDAAGNIYLAGAVAGGTLDLGAGPIAGNSAFLARFDSAGSHVWSAGYGDGKIRALDTDGTHVALAGYTSAGMDFGGGTIGTAGGNDAFVAQLTTAGAHVWSTSFGDVDDQGAFGVSIDTSGNVVVAGSAEGTVDFGGGPLVANFLDLFLVSLTPAGAHSWSQLFDGTFTPGGGIGVTVGLGTGPSDEVVLVGELLGAADLGGGVLTSAGFGDVFVAKFAANGAHAWSASYGSSTGTEHAMSASVDGAGNVLVSGTYAGDTSFGGAVFTATGSASPFLAVFDPAGAHLHSDGFPSQAYTCFSRFMPDENILLQGQGSSSIDFGGGPVSPANLVVAKLEGANGGGTTGVEPLSASSSVRLAASPNPFRPATSIRYSIESPAVASVTVYDVRGRLVETLVPRRPHAAGAHEVRFSSAGAAGVYFVRLETAAAARTVRVVALR